MVHRKKILHVIQSLGNGGCENMLLRTLPRLSDFEHQILTLKEPGVLAPRFGEKGIPVQCVSRKNFLDIGSYGRLFRELRDYRPDIILTYLFHADMLGRLVIQWKTGVPVIPFLRTTYNHSRYTIARVLEWLTKPLVKRYLANSAAVKNFYMSKIGVPENKITVIPNGVDIEYFDSLHPDPKLRDSLGISPDDFVIICVANLHVNKGHRYLLEAFERLHQQFPRTRLLVVGEGEEQARLEQQVSRYASKPAIHFLGQRQDVPQLLKLSHLFVLPTLFEGQSNAILEAMACGLPVITTDIPENRELITHNSTGVLVSPRKSAALVVALIDLIANVQTQKMLGENARQFTQKHRDIKKISLQSSELLLSL